MYQLLVACHILFMVTWLGVDAGVFLGSHMIRNRAYEPGARFLVSRLMSYLDLSPRLSVPLTFATGLTLAWLGQWLAVPQALVWLTWLLAVVWCAAIVWAFVVQHRAEAGHAPTAGQRMWLGRYRRADLWARWAWLAAIVLALVAGMSGMLEMRGGWVAAKLALFGVVILVGNLLRILPGTSSMALMAEIHRLGSTPEREDALYRRLSLTHPIILTMYACVLVAMFLGVLKPF